MKRLLCALAVSGLGAILILAGGDVLAQSNAGQAPDSSKEWPTYGHDSGGMRFSPLTELTPANVGQLKVAGVYHMRPAGFVAPAFEGRAGRGTPGAPVGETPEAAEPGGRGRGGRGGRGGGTGFRPSSATPLVINGIMYFSTPYSRVVAVDPTTGKELWAFALPTGGPSTRGVEYWAGDAQTPPQIVFGSVDGKLYSLDAKTGNPNN